MSDIEVIKQSIEEKIAQAEDMKSLEEIRVSALGKKGQVTEVLKTLGSLPMEERIALGKQVNTVKAELEKLIGEKKAALEIKQLNEKLKQEVVDVTLPCRPETQGRIHPVSKVYEEIVAIFAQMGFEVADGPDIEDQFHNFNALNMPPNHPARQMQDTFYISDEILIRTHTSPVQARTMEKHDFSKGALRMISPGKVFRRDTDDATHSHQVHQIEGLVIYKNVTMADLKGTLEEVMQKMFGADRKIRLRPSYFPFTEPSVEVDVSCFKCGGEGCSVCKHTGWIEILGAGMVHPNVLKMSGIDPEVYSGFAFGLGPDRIAMLRYGVNDIRNFYLNDLRFISQFKGE